MLLGVFIPTKLIYFWTQLNFSIFSFGFLGDWIKPSPYDYLHDVEVTQLKGMYEQVGLKYQSLLVNQLFLITILIAISITDAIVSPFMWWLRRSEGRSKRKWAEYVLRFFHFRVYLRMLIESFLFVMIGGIDDIHQFLKGTVRNTTSSAFSITWIMILLVFITFVWLHYWITSCKKTIIHKDTYWEEMYSKIKNKKYSRAKISVFLLRRLAIALIITWLVGSIKLTYVLIFYSLIQLLNLLYSLIVRSFESKFTNLVEILGDFQFLIISSSLIHFQTESKWFETAIYIQ